MFKKLVVIVLVGGIFLIGVIAAPPVPAAKSQSVVPIDVFLKPDYPAQTVQVFFANAVTGLSSVATVAPFPAGLNILEEFTLTANGVIFRQPGDGLPRLITVNGNILNLSFIPQRTTNLLRVEWVISPNGRTIAWAEIYFEQRWQADLYVARLDGSNLRALPPLPDTAASAYSRVALLAVSDDGNRVFFDREHPTEARRPTDLFIDYQNIFAYVNTLQRYFALPNEPNCLCPATIADNGQTLIRLEPSGTGYAIQVWNLENAQERRGVETIDTIFTQAGDLLVSPGSSLILYTVGGVEGGAVEDVNQYGLILADRTTGQQRLISEISEQRLRAVAFIDRNTATLVVDISAGQTYKMDFETGTLTLVADGIWMGTLQG